VRNDKARKDRSRWFKARLEQLEPRLVLAPALDPSLTGLFTQPKALVRLSDPAFRVGDDLDGDGMIEFESGEPGAVPTSLRIEVSPRAPGFEADIFAIARGPYEDTNNNGVLDPGEDSNFNGTLDCIAGRIWRINPFSGEVTPFNPTTNTPECIPLGTPGGRVIPGGGDLGFGGYVNFFDIAIDSRGIFDGKPAIYVSTVDNAPVLPGLGAVRNAIYRFSPTGAPLDFFDADGGGVFDAGEDRDGDGILDPGEDVNANGILDPDGPPIPFAMFTEDVNFDGTPDDVPAVLAFSPTSATTEFIPPALYVGDVDVDSPGDGNDFFAITGATVLSPITPTSLTRMVIGTEDLNANGILDPGEDLNGDGDLDTFTPDGVLVNEDMETRVRPPAMGGLPDLDMRGFAFGNELVPNIPGTRQVNEDALYGVSTDIEDDPPDGADSLRFFPPPDSLTADDFVGGSQPLDEHLWGDLTFDGVGFFRVDDTALAVESAVLETDHRAGSSPVPGGAVYRVQAGFDDSDPFLFGFNVPEADISINPDGGLDEAFSISLTPDGRRLFVSDLDAIYFVDPLTTLERSEVGQLIGLADLRDLGVPYRGQGLAFAVIDTGVDSSHGGFGGHATEGVNIVIPGSAGTFDLVGHGTAVAGIVSQMVPDATVVPIQLFTAFSGFTQQGTWEAIKYVADNPTVIDPVTGEVSRLVGVTMSFGTITPEELVGNFTNEVHAAQSHFSLVSSLKYQFRRYLKLGITPVGAAGNEGFQSPVGMKGSILPAILREVIEAIASYAYPFDITRSTSPLDRPQGFATPFDVPAAAPAGCAIFPTDFEVFVDKVISFSSRSPFSDFASPGECVRTFASSFVGLGPIEPAFNGTSAATPVHVGQVALARSTVDFWADIFAAGGATTDTYLTSPADVLALSLAGVRNLAPYATADGVNSILQWTAIPILDVDFPDGLDNDIVDQLTVRGRTNFRTYARTDIGNAVAAIEGAMALDYLTAGTKKKLISPRVAVLDLNCNGLVTAAEIEGFINDAARAIGCPVPAGLAAGDIPEVKAMARLLGGTDIAARVRRMQFFDLAADGVLPVPATPSLTLAQFSTLKGILLPKPNAFKIVNRNPNLGFLLAPDRRRYEDLAVTSTGLYSGLSSKRAPATLSQDPIAPLFVPAPPSEAQQDAGAAGAGDGNAAAPTTTPLRPGTGETGMANTGSGQTVEYVSASAIRRIQPTTASATRVSTTTLTDEALAQETSARSSIVKDTLVDGIAGAIQAWLQARSRYTR
jgi:hypothetical protein